VTNRPFLHFLVKVRTQDEQSGQCAVRLLHADFAKVSLGLARAGWLAVYFISCSVRFAAVQAVVLRAADA
jgi:hypothetical protein